MSTDAIPALEGAPEPQAGGIEPGDAALEATLSKSLATVLGDEEGPSPEPPAPPASKAADKPKQAAASDDAPPPDESATSEQPSAGPGRDPETGRFTAKAPDGDAVAPPTDGAEPDASAKTAAEPPEAEPRQEPKPAELTDQWKDAPGGFHDKAKEAWRETPAEVRAETTRRITELESGIAEHQQRWAPLQNWDDLARQHQTSIPDALQRYTQFERMIRENPVEGLRAACADMDLNFDAIVESVGGFQGEPALQYAHQQLAAAQNEAAALRAQVAELQGAAEQQQRERIQSEIAAFQSDPRYSRYEELAPTMAGLLHSGIATNMASAYGMADRMLPASAPAPAPAAQTRETTPEPAPVAQTRPPDPAASLSPTGAPDRGTGTPKRNLSTDPTHDIESALLRVGI